jgi:hypothetical protein
MAKNSEEFSESHANLGVNLNNSILKSHAKIDHSDESPKAGGRDSMSPMRRQH